MDAKNCVVTAYGLVIFQGSMTECLNKASGLDNKQIYYASDVYNFIDPHGEIIFQGTYEECANQYKNTEWKIEKTYEVDNDA